jgi:hypothetical protein
MTVHRINISVVRAGKRGLLYDAEYGGEVICSSSLTPFLDGCRVLRARGLSGPVEMWDAVRPYPRMKSTIEAAAKLTVRDTGHWPAFRRWHSEGLEGGQDGDFEDAK